jgi:hypothetical protein
MKETPAIAAPRSDWVIGAEEFGGGDFLERGWLPAVVASGVAKNTFLDLVLPAAGEADTLGEGVKGEETAETLVTPGISATKFDCDAGDGGSAILAVNFINCTLADVASEGRRLSNFIRIRRIFRGPPGTTHMADSNKKK